MNLLAPIYSLLNPIQSLATTLVSRLTAGRASALDYLDAAISTRAVASTALSNANWTNTRAGLLDNLTRLDATISGIGGLKCRLFTSGTTWTSPASAVSAMVIAVGGGGGGCYINSSGDVMAGTAGGDTSFGTLVTAVGGAGGGSTPGTGAGYVRGGFAFNDYSAYVTCAVSGPATPGFLGIGYGGSALTTRADNDSKAWSGNSGAVATYFGTIAANTSITVTVGSGGASGSDSNGARPGSSGAVLLFYW